jgi:hypothetical protein
VVEKEKGRRRGGGEGERRRRGERRGEVTSPTKKISLFSGLNSTTHGEGKKKEPFLEMDYQNKQQPCNKKVNL